MTQLQIDLGDNGYSIRRGEGQALIQGIQKWETACELHEMLSGELEGDREDDRRSFHIDMVENGYAIFDSGSKQPLIEGIREWNVAWELHEMLTGEYDA